MKANKFADRLCGLVIRVNLNLYTERVDLEVMFYTCVVDVIISNLGQDIGYAEQNFSFNSSTTSGKF
jgi:hypothetical protein